MKSYSPEISSQIVRLTITSGGIAPHAGLKPRMTNRGTRGIRGKIAGRQTQRCVAADARRLKIPTVSKSIGASWRRLLQILNTRFRRLGIRSGRRGAGRWAEDAAHCGAEEQAETYKSPPEQPQASVRPPGVERVPVPGADAVNPIAWSEEVEAEGFAAVISVVCYKMSPKVAETAIQSTSQRMSATRVLMYRRKKALVWQSLTFLAFEVNLGALAIALDCI